MKKLLVICLSLVMVFSATMIAFAEPGAFISSPSGRPAPELIDYESDSDECNAIIKLTPYSLRDTLEKYLREKLEKAYEQIASMDRVNAFYKTLAKLAKQKNMNVDSLSVSDLFDISAFGCDEHGEHDGFTIKVKAESIPDFVGLIHFNDDECEIVEIKEIDREKNTISFYVDDLSPFAIVVDNGSGAESPKTGDNSTTYLWVALATVSGLALVFVLIKNKKVKENI